MKNFKFSVTSLIILTVFCIFAVCIMNVLMTGATVYGRMVDQSQAMFDKRTAIRYITTRIRQSDTAEDVRVEDFEGQSAFVFREEIEGQLYDTHIYCYDGYIRELFAVADGLFSPEDGEKILKANNVEFVEDGLFLTVYITFTDHTEQTLRLYIRSN